MNYKNSGVDIERGNDFIDVIKNICKHDKLVDFLVYMIIMGLN
jgi:phosphoribosylaminoimidazole (AIR) synthetase